MSLRKHLNRIKAEIINSRTSTHMKLLSIGDITMTDDYPYVLYMTGKDGKILVYEKAKLERTYISPGNPNVNLLYHIKTISRNGTNTIELSKNEYGTKWWLYERSEQSIQV